MAISHIKIKQALSQANPIVQREFRYQRFIIERGRNGILWIALAVLMVVPALIASIIYSVATLFNLLPIIEFYNLPTSFHAYPTVLILILNLSLYPVVTLINLALARESIAHEKEGRTWQILRLTSLNNLQIILGKWWASLKALNGDQIMVIILRVGLAACYIGILLPSVHSTLDNTMAPYALYLVTIAPLIVMQALLDAMLTAIVGVIAAIPDEAVGTVMTSTVLIGRLFSAILVGVWFVWMMNALRFSLTKAIFIGLVGIMINVLLVILGLFLANYMLDHH